MNKEEAAMRFENDFWAFSVPFDPKLVLLVKQMRIA